MARGCPAEVERDCRDYRYRDRESSYGLANCSRRGICYKRACLLSFFLQNWPCRQFYCWRRRGDRPQGFRHSDRCEIDEQLRGTIRI